MFTGTALFNNDSHDGLHAPTLNSAYYPGDSTDGATREDTHEFSEKCNCKQELLRQSFTPTAQKSGEIEICRTVERDDFSSFVKY